MSKIPQPVTGGTRMYKRPPGQEHSIVFTHGDALVDFGDERMRAGGAGGVMSETTQSEFSRVT